MRKYVNASRKMLFAVTIFIYSLNSLWVVCRAVPLMDLRNIVEEKTLDAMITSECSSNGECWEWLPLQEVHENTATEPENLPLPKMHTRRQAPNIDPNTIIESWDDSAATLEKSNPSLVAVKANGNRLSKKDVLMSRSWGAGGMPFSVLYMKPHSPRGNHASNEQQHELRKAANNQTPPMGQTNSRIAVRNGGPTLPRRQYSIIPQLFISYGWGPFGK